MQYIPVIPAKLISNLDETGSSDWEERKRRSILVSPEYADESFHSPVDSAIRHQTLRRCISASGDAYCPLPLSANHEILAIVDREMQENIAIQILIVDSPYMTAHIFINYLSGIVIPAVEKNCLLPGSANKSTVLFATIVHVTVMKMF